MQMTLDGFAEFPDGPDDEPEATRQFWEEMWTRHYDDIDTLLLGRRTYEKWAGFWPARVEDDNVYMRGFARFADRVQKVVFSRSLKSADWANSRIARGPVAEEIARIRALPGKNVVVAGGPRLVQSVLAENLADEFYLVVYSSIIGRGKPLFRWEPDPEHDDDRVPPGAQGRHDFRLLDTHPIGTGAVLLHYGSATDGAPTEQHARPGSPRGRTFPPRRRRSS